nr:hypothetical protein [Actinomadura madurae]
MAASSATRARISSRTGSASSASSMVIGRLTPWTASAATSARCSLARPRSARRVKALR